MEYRKELKYFISKKEIVILDEKLKKTMQLDSLSKLKKYNVRSIYFDSYNNKNFYENDAGINERYKLRIRVYNRSYDDIKLEFKYKKNGCTKKEFCTINKALCRKLIEGKKINYNECNNGILKKLYFNQQLYLFKPKIMVEYDRVAYVDKIGNVRVTFDMDIRATAYLNRLFYKNTYARPVLIDNLDILEIKYDELIPDYVIKSLGLKSLEETSFSKYYWSRMAFRGEIL